MRISINKKQSPLVFLGVLFGLSTAEATSAQELVGAKAPALGGAFCGNKIGDASSLVYNPAALAKSSGFNINASVTGYSFYKLNAEGAYGGKDLGFSSLGSNSFVGFVNPLKYESLTNLAIAFYVPQNLTVDMDLKLGKATEFKLEDIYQAQKTQLGTYSGIIGIGRALNNGISVGVAAQTYYLTNSRQNFVHSIFRSEFTDSATNSTKQVLLHEFNSTKAEASAVAAGARFGILWEASETLTFGAAISKSRIVQTKISGRSNDWSVATFEDGTVVPPNSLQNVSGTIVTSEFLLNNKNQKPFEPFPMLFRIGASWAPSAATKINSDIFVSNRNIWKEAGMTETYQTTANFAIGMEQIFAHNYMMAGGVFSDFDENPPFSLNQKNNDKSHIDHTGVSLSFGISAPDGESAFTLVHQYGRGKDIPVMSNSKDPKARNMTEQSTTAQFSLTKKI
jgi:hypothetical protein